MSLKRATDLLLKHATPVRRRSAKGSRSIRTVKFSETGADRREVQFALSYLNAFGYLNEELAKWKDVKLEDILSGIKRFQDFFGLVQDGTLCAKTIKAMEAPRCGMPDLDQPHLLRARAVKDWAEAKLPSWRKRSLRYTISDYLPGWDQSMQQQIIHNAFLAWTQHGNIDVEMMPGSGNADIIISTGAGPRSNFDGPGGTLAWAFLPQGDDQQLTMKFDLGETWVAGSNMRGILLFNVACHEIGHLFGLDHSRIEAALMAPFYNQSIAVPQLNDDIPRFQARYGVRGNVPPPNPFPPPTTPNVRTLSLELAAGSKITLDGKAV